MIVIISVCGMVWSMRSLLLKTILLGFVFSAAIAITPKHASSAPMMDDGAGMVVVPLDGTATVDAINVWYYRPQNSGPNVPIVFIMHGLNRNADTYRDNWIALAETGRFVILAPEFQKQGFPSSFEYNLGNVMARSGVLNPKAEWSFSIIEAVFEQIVVANDLKAARYDMFGHSAGAQFVHRYMLFMPTTRIRTAVAANAGWYTVPDLSTDFPYGLGRSGVTVEQMAQSLSQDLVILLGTEDNDPNGRHLRKSPEAMMQGAHRVARGESFINHATKAASQFKSPLNWRLAYVPGVGHSNRRMAQQAAKYIGYPLNPADIRD